MIETLRHIDYRLFYFINHDCANDFLDFLCPVLREKLVWLPVYALIAWHFFKVYGTRAWWLAVSAAVTIIMSDQLSSAIIKPIFHRLRPCNNPDLAATIRLVIHDCGGGFSFVSSHAANHFALATFLSFIIKKRMKFVPVLYLWAASIALSQVYVGVHFPADVTAGALVGIAVGSITGLIARRKILIRIHPSKN